MRGSILKPIFIAFAIFSGLLNCYSQNHEEKITAIDKYIQYINENADKHNFYDFLFLDGQVKSSIFRARKVIGAYAETYIMKESQLVKVTKGTRIFLNEEKTTSTNLIETFVFKNESLCYYSENKFYVTKNQIDSLIYEVGYYIENGTILKSNSKGIFNQNLSEYVKRVIRSSLEKIEEKNKFEK